MLPRIKTHFDSAMSAIDWVIAPEPNAPGKSDDRRRMAETGAVVDVGGLQDRTGELLHQVVLLVGDTGRCKACHLFALVGLELRRNQLVGLVPARLDKLPILLDERFGEPVGTVDEFICIGPLGAELAFVDRVALPGCDSDNLLVLDNKVEAAPGSAIRTRSWYIFYFHFTPLTTENPD